MSTFLKQIDEIHEADTEAEAMTLIEQAKETFDITRTSVTYKYKKAEDREYYIVTVRKSFKEDE